MLTRSDSSEEYDAEPCPLHALTTKQRAIVELIDAFQRTTGEPCSGRYLARRLSVDPTTVRSHLSALYRKGWLKTPTAPAALRARKWLDR